MARTEHSDPGWAFRLRVVFSAGSSCREENLRETCRDSRVRPACAPSLSASWGRVRLTVHLVVEAELHGEVLAVGHGLAAGHQRVDRHLSRRCQAADPAQRHRKLPAVD